MTASGAKLKPEVIRQEWMERGEFVLQLCGAPLDEAKHDQKACDYCLGPTAYERGTLRVVDENNQPVRDDNGQLMTVTEPRHLVEKRAKRDLTGTLYALAAERAAKRAAP